jgi:membrane protein implicated in regulation of membrane protease activity
MALVVGVLLAVFVFDGPLQWVAVVVGGAIEVGESFAWWRWSVRRRPRVGVEALVGRTVDVERGWTQVAGERWRVLGVADGRARIVAVDGLTLVVERER